MALFGEQFADMLTTRFGRGILRSLAALQSQVPSATITEVRHMLDLVCGVSCWHVILQSQHMQCSPGDPYGCRRTLRDCNHQHLQLSMGQQHRRGAPIKIRKRRPLRLPVPKRQQSP